MKIKELICMAMLAMVTVSCGSETPEIPNVPGNEEDIPGGNIEKPVDQKKNPALTDLVNVNKKIADALKGKTSEGKVDLSSYFTGYSYVSSTFKNNKYTVSFADGSSTVIDLNEYKAASRSCDIYGSRSVVSSRSEDEDTGVFSNAKVFLWEPAPFGALVDKQVGAMLEEYAGTENMVRVTGQGCTWQSLMEMPEYAIVVLNGLGADGKWIVTGQEYTSAADYSSMKDYISIYTAVVDGVAKHYYMVNDSFVAQCMAPLVKRGLVINAASSSADGNHLAEAFAKIGYTSYLGFDNMVQGEWAAETAGNFLAGMMGERYMTGEAFETVNNTYEFKLDEKQNVKVSPVFVGDQELKCPFTAYTDRMAVAHILEHYECDEALSFETLLNDGKIVLDYNQRINMLDLGECGLEGEVSDRFMWLDQLYMLNLDGNRLSGEIPAFLGELPRMTGLMLQDNLFTGNIPASFERYYTNSGFVNLTGNKMNGQIPFGKYADNNIFFQFDHKYQYESDGTVITNDHGLWFSDEPVK